MNEPELHTLADIPGHHARYRPGHNALSFEGVEVTYQELHLESNRTAHGLRGAGLERGARVGYLGKESVHYYDIIFGCAKSGIVLVPVNWRLTAPEIEHILRDSDAELVFAEREFLETVTRLKKDLHKLRTVVALDTDEERGTGFRDWKADRPDTDLNTAADPGDPAAQVYTSGTTGTPKGAVIANRSFFALRDSMRAGGLTWVDWKPDDRSLISLSGLHLAGLNWSMQGFTAGVTNVAMRSFIGQEAVRLIRDLGITTTFVAPAMLQMMLAEPAAGTETFASLRKIVYGASPISESLLAQCLEVIKADFVQAYSATEAGNAVTLLPPSEHIPGSPRLRAAGFPCPGIEVRIVTDDGRTAGPGETGEVCVRTPARMLGYWKNPQATAATLVDDWLHMGDAGYLDADGCLFLRDRVKDTIIVAGANVHPTEVEDALRRHPAVAEAAVFGVPDETWGEAVHACVVLRPDEQVTPRQLMLSLKGDIADYKIPLQYTFAESLPRNPTGKVLRRELRELYWVGRQSGIH
ncbi:long-chain-fatty-acid--CoA ligase [Streptomyces sp. DB-54]